MLLAFRLLASTVRLRDNEERRERREMAIHATPPRYDTTLSLSVHVTRISKARRSGREGGREGGRRAEFELQTSKEEEARARPREGIPHRPRTG